MRGFIRGHPVIWDGMIYRYADGTPAEAWGGEPRPCVLCQQMPEPCVEEGCSYRPETGNPGQWLHDPCLGHLAGYRSACCGHGVEGGYRRRADGKKERTARLTAVL